MQRGAGAGGAGPVGQRVGEGDEVEEVVGVQVADDQRVHFRVREALAQLGEHAVAAVQEERSPALVHEVAAARAAGVGPGRRFAQDGDAHGREQ